MAVLEIPVSSYNVQMANFLPDIFARFRENITRKFFDKAIYYSATVDGHYREQDMFIVCFSYPHHHEIEKWVERQKSKINEIALAHANRKYEVRWQPYQYRGSSGRIAVFVIPETIDPDLLLAQKPISWYELQFLATMSLTDRTDSPFY